MIDNLAFKCRVCFALMSMVALSVYLIAFFLIAESSADSAATSNNIAEPSLLVEEFGRMAFQKDFISESPNSSYSLTFITKWTWPVRIDLSGFKNENRILALNLEKELRRLTALSIRVVPKENNMDKNFFAHVLNQNEFKDLLNSLTRFPEIINKLAKRPCSGFYMNKENGNIYRAFIIIKDLLDDDKKRQCLLSGMAGAIGFPSNSSGNIHSFLSGERSDLKELPLNDKILIRTLYDKRITPGMPRAEAMKIVREIIPELVAKTRAYGVEALYQK